MPKFYANICYSFDLNLIASVNAVEKGRAGANEWIEEHRSDNDEFPDMYENFLLSESGIQAVSLLGEVVSFSRRDPWGVKFVDEGLFLCESPEDLIVEIPSLEKLFSRGAINYSAQIRVESQGWTNAEVKLVRGPKPELLWEEAEKKANGLLKIVHEMIKIDFNLPDGWKFENKLKVVVEGMSVFKQKTWWEKEVKEFGRDITTNIVKPTIKRNIRKNTR